MPKKRDFIKKIRLVLNDILNKPKIKLKDIYDDMEGDIVGYRCFIRCCHYLKDNKLIIIKKKSEGRGKPVHYELECIDCLKSLAWLRKHKG